MAKHVLVYGGNGALGRALVSHFKAQNWVVTNIDMAENPESNTNITVSASDSWEAQSTKILDALHAKLGDEKLNAILCVAGGWAGGNAASADLIKNSELMWKQSVHSSTISAQIAAKFLAPGGLLTLTGARAATGATPGMIGYGMAKAAVMQLTKSLASEGSGLPKDAHVNIILPVTIDTPANRKWAAADTDFGTWTSPQDIANKLFEWASNPSTAVNGSWVEVLTSQGKTAFNVISQ